jgi:hypothetical protein
MSKESSSFKFNNINSIIPNNNNNNNYESGRLMIEAVDDIYNLFD